MGNPIGELVKRLRLEHEWTMRDLSERMGPGYSHANLSAKEADVLPLNYARESRLFSLCPLRFVAILWQKARPEVGRL